MARRVLSTVASLAVRFAPRLVQQREEVRNPATRYSAALGRFYGPRRGRGFPAVAREEISFPCRDQLFGVLHGHHRAAGDLLLKRFSEKIARIPLRRIIEVARAEADGRQSLL